MDETPLAAQSSLKTSDMSTGKKLNRKNTLVRRDRLAKKRKNEKARRTAAFISFPHQIIEDGLEVVVG